MKDQIKGNTSLQNPHSEDIWLRQIHHPHFHITSVNGDFARVSILDESLS
jgi:hypothetical protein